MEKDKRKSFLLYSEHIELINQLTNEQAGELIKGIFHYVNTGENPSLNPFSNLVFISIRQDLDRNAVKYEEKRQKLAENGKKGGRPKKHTDENTEPEISKNMFKETNEEKNHLVFSKSKKSLYVNVNDNVNVNVNENENVNEKEISSSSSLSPSSSLLGFDDFSENQQEGYLVDDFSEEEPENDVVNGDCFEEKKRGEDFFLSHKRQNSLKVHSKSEDNPTKIEENDYMDLIRHYREIAENKQKKELLRRKEKT